MIIKENWGVIEYAAAWEKQKEYFQARVNKKLENNTQELPDIAVFCQHPHVYTLGKSGVAENLLVSNQMLIDEGVSFFNIDRGGDITYHGPGQIVGYPIFDLEHFGIGLKQYIYNLEEAVIRFLSAYNIKGERLEGSIGVWLDTDDPGKARKICAIGVKSSRFITMHGLALNINTDLKYFNYINPCGFVDKGVTSLQKETGVVYDIEKCTEELYNCINEVFIVFNPGEALAVARLIWLLIFSNNEVSGEESAFFTKTLNDLNINRKEMEEYMDLPLEVSYEKVKNMNSKKRSECVRLLRLAVNTDNNIDRKELGILNEILIKAELFRSDKKNKKGDDELQMY